MTPIIIPTDSLTVPKVIEALNAAIGDINTRYALARKISSQVWINILLEHLSSMGRSLGYDVSPAVGDVNPTWLYDMIWKESNSNDEPPLVVESSWSKAYLDSKDDFEKLLMANSGLRLLITYGGDNEKDRERALDIVEKLKKQIDLGSLSQAGERFLFATIVRDSNNIYLCRYEFVEKQ